MAVNPSRADIAKAREFLKRRKIRADEIRPRDLAAAAKENAKTFAETLRMIAVLHMQGQGGGPAPVAADIARRGRVRTS